MEIKTLFVKAMTLQEWINKLQWVFLSMFSWPLIYMKAAKNTLAKTWRTQYMLSKLIFTEKDLEARSEELGDGHGHPSESIALVLRVRGILKVAPFKRGKSTTLAKVDLVTNGKIIVLFVLPLEHTVHCDHVYTWATIAYCHEITQRKPHLQADWLSEGPLLSSLLPRTPSSVKCLI